MNFPIINKKMFKTLISTEELTELLGQPNVVIVDCRFSLADKEGGRKDYLQSHIPNAVYAHLDDDLSSPIIEGKTGRHPMPSIETFTQQLGEWGIYENTQVIAYDQSHGGIAARLWFLLKWLGHEKVAVLNGGWKHWTENGGVTSSEVPSIYSKIFKANPNPNLLVDVQFMEANIDNDDYIYFDSRTAPRYRGEEEPIDPVAGHIPSAISAPFLDNLREDGLFLEKSALAQRFVNILKDLPRGKAIFYCGSGVTACHNLLAMHHLGLTTPRLFPGSWSEWIVDENRTVATGA